METCGKQFRKRNAILACLQRSTAHPTAEALHRMLQEEYSDISLATVYRNLALFKAQGLIVSVGALDGSERFDGRLEPHIHFGCTRCGSVEDVEAPELAAQLADFTSSDKGCRVDSAQLMLCGLCKSCLNM